MVEKYLFFELLFLVPLILAVAFSVHRRNDTAELRFFWIATSVSVLLIALNVVLISSNVGFPATVAFLLLISAYAIRPALMGSCLSTLMGVMAVVAAYKVADTYSNSHVGSFADRNHSLFTSFTALIAGIATVVLVQISIKYVARLR